MGTMTFQINDKSTDTTAIPAVWVNVSENLDGTLSFRLSVDGRVTGDLRGFFFDIADESLLGTLQITSTGYTQFVQGNDSIVNLGGGATMAGLTGSDGGFDAGVEIGTAGIGKDDIQQFAFTLKASRALTLNDLANINVGARLTSVGDIGSSRALSSKILETTFRAVNATDDVANTAENLVANANLLSNDKQDLAVNDQTSITDWTGGTLGQTILLANAEGASLVVNADGSYVLDASAANALSANEVLTYTYGYDVKNVNNATSWSSDTATFTVTVTGINDAPVAADDTAGQVLANTGTEGNVLQNDQDIDRLDTLSVTSINGTALQNGSATITLSSGALVTIAADGSYVYDTNGAFSTLYAGSTATETLQYAISDGQGGTASALLTVTIDGVGSAPVVPPVVRDEGLSHGYWKNHESDWNIDTGTSFETYFGVNPGTWVVKSRGNAVTVNDISFTEALALSNGQTTPAAYALAREAVAAVLNALDEHVDYYFSASQVISMVQLAYAGGDIEGTKDILEYNNTLGEWNPLADNSSGLTLIGQ